MAGISVSMVVLELGTIWPMRMKGFACGMCVLLPRAFPAREPAISAAAGPGSRRRRRRPADCAAGPPAPISGSGNREPQREEPASHAQHAAPPSHHAPPSRPRGVVRVRRSRRRPVAAERGGAVLLARPPRADRKSTRLNSSHANISYAVFCLKKKKKLQNICYHEPEKLEDSLTTRNMYRETVVWDGCARGADPTAHDWPRRRKIWRERPTRSN